MVMYNLAEFNNNYAKLQKVYPTTTKGFQIIA